MRSMQMRARRSGAAACGAVALGTTVLACAVGFVIGGCQTAPHPRPTPPPATMPATAPAETVEMIRQTLKGQTVGEVTYVSSEDPKLAIVDRVEGGTLSPADTITVMDPRDQIIVNHGVVVDIGQDTKKPVIRCSDPQAKRNPALGDLVIKNP